ncbi:hypothetical protein [Lysinibacillus sp. RC79]|uniref:hypothetical protein n=1 Tax=Lysinibacillus sp. RC79 TaxID=3156296 RepID=UPI0035121461
MIGLEELYSTLEKGTGYPVANIACAQRESVPFIVIMTEGSVNLIADNKVYKKFEDVEVELYTDKRDLEAEGSVEKILDNLSIPYQSNAYFIAEEDLLKTTYSITIKGDK